MATWSLRADATPGEGQRNKRDYRKSENPPLHGVVFGPPCSRAQPLRAIFTASLRVSYTRLAELQESRWQPADHPHDAHALIRT